MQNLTIAVTVALTLILGACASNASKTFTVDVSPIGVEYTPRLIRDFLNDRGYERVPFERSDDSRSTSVMEVRTATLNEQHFIFKSAPQFEVVIRVETDKRLFGGNNPRVVVRFIENGRSDLSAAGQKHYDQLFAQVVKKVGAGQIER